MECSYQWSVLTNGAFGPVHYVRRRVEFPNQFREQVFTYEGHAAKIYSDMRHVYDMHEVLGTWQRRSMYPILPGTGEKAGSGHQLKSRALSCSLMGPPASSGTELYSRTHANRRSIEEAR